MNVVESFLTTEQEISVINAIKVAEKNTSGEIRIHLENNTKKPSLAHSKEVFLYLKMDNTKDRNGVLIYVGVANKQIAILGDKGINNAVPDMFWDSVRDIVLDKFKIGDYTEGLKLGIIEAGNKLKQFFPYQKNDNNELDDSISLS